MIKPLLLSFSLVLLTACASPPKQVNITTEPVNLAVQYTNTAVTLKSRDIRNANYLIVIHQAGKPAQLINNQDSLVTTVATDLQQGWKQQGLVFAPKTNITINLELQTARIDVQQDNFEYVAESSLALIVSIKNKDQTLTKQFTSTSTMTGIFSPAITDLEAKFSQQLTRLHNEIFNDPQINDYLKR